jgi:hypothetical protein
MFGISLFLKIKQLRNYSLSASIWHAACSYRLQDWTSA